MTFFKSDPPKYLPQNSVLFSMDPSEEVIFSLIDHPILGRKIPLLLISKAPFFLCSFLPGFSFEFMCFVMQETVVLIYIPAVCV